MEFPAYGPGKRYSSILPLCKMNWEISVWKCYLDFWKCSAGVPQHRNVILCEQSLLFLFFFFFVGGKVLWKSLLLSGEVNFILNLKTRRLKMLKQFLVIGKRFNIVRFIDITCSVWKFKFFFFFLEGSIFRWITYLDFSLLCFMPNVKDEVANISRVGNRLPTGVGGKSGVSCERNFWLHLWDECMCEMISGPSSVICNCVCICF